MYLSSIKYDGSLAELTRLTLVKIVARVFFCGYILSRGNNVLSLPTRKTNIMEIQITSENFKFYFDFIKKSTSDGKLFSVVFTKKDGSERKMTARRGVSKYLKGGKLNHNPDEYGNIIVADADIMRENAKLAIVGMKEKNPYRTIKVSSLKQIKIGGNIFKFI